jgi:thymidylate synthase (FAD)
LFYIPGPDRNLVQQGKPGAYTFVPGSDDQHKWAVVEMKYAAQVAYDSYVDMLGAGVAKEVARSVLPVNIYSKMFVTMNARSAMSFLSLRTKSEGSTFPSFPQREIEMCAEKIEAHFAGLFPLTHAAFVKNGRVSP